MPHNPELVHILQEAIRQSPEHRLTFAEFMHEVLYHPLHGYYTSQETPLGPQGDFVTSSHLGHDFGALLAVQFEEMWHRLERPNPFYLVEMGAGQGLVAADVLTHLDKHYPECFSALVDQIVEKSEALQETQRDYLKPWQDRVTWTTLEAIADGSVTGCFFSNELVDALPVHLVQHTEAGLQEIYVTTENPGPLFAETIGPLSSQALTEYFAFSGVDLSRPEYPSEYRTEVHLAALDWIKTVAAKLHRGYVLTIDYGYPADRYYGRARSQGTLQCYYQHAHHNDPYQHVGHQDITVHVNFTGLEHQGERWGLKTIGSTQQAMFLMALGLGDRLNALAAIQETDTATLNLAIQRRDKLHQLINPMGVGNFIVLIQAKNLDPQGEALKGLAIPPLI